jgi:protein-S-isoprenylcysteine O-methyltransferase Ste14
MRFFIATEGSQPRLLPRASQSIGVGCTDGVFALQRTFMTQYSRIARRIRVPLGFVFALLYLWLAKPSLRCLLSSLLLIIPGLLIRALASGHVRKNEALATSGPYAYTRNPLYLGSLLIGIGFAVAARSWWVGFLLVVMFFAIYLPVIRDEETFLRQKFPEFDEYAQRVPRMFPRLTPPSAVATEASGFSRALYLQHHEYNALGGTLAVLAALLVKMWFRK